MASTSLQDIRVWGRDNGYPEIGDKDPIPPALRNAYSKRDAAEQPAMEAPKGEIAPKVVRPTVVQRAKDFGDKIKAAAPKTPARAKPRMGIDRIITRAWDMMGRLVQPMNLPMGRVMAIQAPVAGALLEEIIKGTLVDKLLQPLARAEAKGEIAFALLGPPIFVGLLTMNPQAQTVLVPMLKESMRIWLDVAGPHLEVVAKKEAEFHANYGARIDEMLEIIFAPPENAAAMPPE